MTACSAGIVDGEIPSDQVYADDLVVAFRDIAPARADAHPRDPAPRTSPRSADLTEDDAAAAAARIFAVAAEVARERGRSPTTATGSSRTSARTAARPSPTSTSTCMGGRRLTWPPG